MEKEIEKLGNIMEEKFPPVEGEDYSVLTSEASRIANIALCTFHGELLSRALDIAKAIVEFEDALTLSGQQK